MTNQSTGTESTPGTRLERFELYNWGTFDRVVWGFDLGRRDALITGDIGSGKSTAVDALTTLLLPAHRVSYNRAAGADSKERDLRSYVLGYYKSEQVEESGTTRPVALRGPSDYSVILGIFAGPRLGEVTTIAQVFRAREDNSQPERFFVVADEALSIVKHFTGFGTTLPELKRQLRGVGARLYDHFPEYARDLQRQLHVPGDQALDLFHQTVSMKAVDNLNDFVRSHMLEPFDMTGRISDLITHFDDLTTAHEAVVRAREQLELLTPIVDELDSYDEHRGRIEQLDARRCDLVSARPVFVVGDDFGQPQAPQRLVVFIESAATFRPASVEFGDLAFEGRDPFAAGTRNIGEQLVASLLKFEPSHVEMLERRVGV